MTRNVPDPISRIGSLSHRGLIRIEGSDAARLLQGQLSNDINVLSVGHQQFTSLNSPKGRLLATGFLMRAASETYWFDLPQTLVEPVAKRLKMFVLRSDVRIDALNTASAIAVIGVPQADILPADLQAALAPLLADNASTNAGHLLPDGRLTMPRPGHPPRWVIWSSTPLDGEFQDLTDAWRLADIQAGIPNLTPETQDRFIAQHAGVDLLDGISFTKGCFTGQEVIARLHYLGQAKRFLVLGTSSTAPETGHRLLRTTDDTPVGEVVESMMSSGQSHWLAVLQGGAFAPADLQLSSDQPVISLRYFKDEIPSAGP
jgi:tRNA-modifying protein YgfZ